MLRDQARPRFGHPQAIRNHVEAAAGDVPRTYRKIMDPMVWDPADERWVRTTSLHA